MKRMAGVVGSLALMCGIAGAQADLQVAQDRLVHVNEIQVIGTHNSYHTGFGAGTRGYLEAKQPKTLRSLDYKHGPLAEQLAAGVRQIELDTFADPQGGRFAHPGMVKVLERARLPADPPYDPDGVMAKPGFKVMHVQDLDQRSSCMTFVLCLTQVREWSKANAGHLPIFILVETKQGKPEGMPNAVDAERYTPALFDALDAEIRSVFRPEEMVTPDDVRGGAATLDAAIRGGGWPTLEKVRGRVIFLMDQRWAGPMYEEGHPALKGRVIFANATPGAADAAFVEQNDGTVAQIAALVKQGYLVRTRSDEGTEQARTNDTTRRDLALKSGAQMVSTDYPVEEPSQWTPFVVKLPGGAAARCNPVNKPAGCRDDLLGK